MTHAAGGFVLWWMRGFDGARKMAISANDWERQDLELRHHGLRTVHWEIKSKRTLDYNCISFALGIEDRRWTPEPQIGDCWPDDIPQKNTTEAWLALFEKFSFVRCNDENFEVGYEKIAIYIDREDETPSHVAKLKDDGVWHSKMGTLQDITHPLRSLSYGEPMYFLKRKNSSIKRPNRKTQRRAYRH